MTLYARLLRALQRPWVQLASSDTVTGIALATAVGVGAGLGAVAFRWLIENFHHLFFVRGAEIFSFLGDYYVIIIPAIGGLFVGLIIYFLLHIPTSRSAGPCCNWGPRMWGAFRW